MPAESPPHDDIIVVSPSPSPSSLSKMSRRSFSGNPHKHPRNIVERLWACIDDNLHMVEFLVKRGADINRQDNEGWTPLHATASCGFVSIARYLVENGADVAAVNSDGDLALDLAIDVQHRGMIEYMEKIVQELNIDVEQARKAEEEAMLSDAERWLSSDAAEVDRPHPKTGATALHVAAAKGYTNVLSLLLEGRGNVDRQDNDGWTPLHAASHWGQQGDLPECWSESLADMDIRNYAGQSMHRSASSSNCASSSEASLPIDNDNDDIDDDDDAVAHESDAEELSDSTESSHTTSLSGESEAENVKPNQQQIHALEHPVEEEAPWRRKMARAPHDSPTNNPANNSNSNNNNNLSSNNNNKFNNNNNDTSETAAATAEHTSSISDASQQEPQPPPPPTTPPPAIIPTSDETEIETILAPSPVQSANDTTASFTLSAPSRRSVVVDDDDDGDGDGDGKAGGDADDPEAVVSASYTIVSRRDKIPDSAESEPEQVESNKQKTDEQQAESEEQKARPTDLPLSAAPTEAIKSSSSTTPGSLESPVRLRDKRGLSGSSQETDTKSDTASPVSAHPDFNARDSLLSLYARRTTDGSGGASAAAAAAAATATGGAGTGAGGAGGSSTSTSTAERRPSWRLKFDAGSKFKLEDNTSGGTYPPNNSTIIPSAPAVMAAANLSTTTGIQRRISSGPNALNASNQSLNSVGRPISAPSESTNNSSAYATPAVRKYETTSTGAGTGVGARAGAAATTTATTTANSVSATSANHAAGTAATTNATSSHDDKENDKENDNRTQTVIQRRRKPKRRSTGVVHLDVDELDPERQNEEKDKEILNNSMFFPPMLLLVFLNRYCYSEILI
ncbi:GL25084 [Drosophila persimilis]|uniref:GL25084 n=1 Tax=Drosophila persimilis TaxID=7234 RepID=B4GQU7_DROPE|nr:GL25084 [Drosophila persimilis]